MSPTLEDMSLSLEGVVCQDSETLGCADAVDIVVAGAVVQGIIPSDHYLACSALERGNVREVHHTFSGDCKRGFQATGFDVSLDSAAGHEQAGYNSVQTGGYSAAGHENPAKRPREVVDNTALPAVPKSFDSLFGSAASVAETGVREGGRVS